ncbi:uncharacterized protein LOC108135237 isoform X1 [Drosophila elegans]|uniref:uncharacterized protein LOC108135237 isoform X1 n=2 Tax=Drosophila elegans TaxID=30023 RepID=UPI0007E61B53|nr:uncharacterized protein LOC108135237 isoform X1 [Drosophila elegans]
MSGLKKFQDNEEWRQKLRAFLMADRLPKKPVKMDESKDMRYSLEIDEDLRRPLEARKKKIEAAKPVSLASINLNEETMYGGGSLDQLDDGDDSFSAFERMCDKTGSDPDSTLFQYLHSEDRSQVMAKAKDRSTDDQKEIEALRRMLEAVGADDDLLDNESPVKGVECTQLEDVEAPSRFWDNTLAGNDDSASGSEPKHMAKVSPVKMVGLLRPSTIIEDNELESDVSSHISFQSARTLKTNASSCYETATDGSLSGTLLNVDDLFYAAIAKTKPPEMSKAEELELLSDLHGSLRELSSLPMQEEEEPLDVMEDTIIELSSSDDEEVQLVSEVKQEETSCVSTVDVDNPPEKERSENSLENKENMENSLHFNDTMEEMQYMMEKGMQYMDMAGATPTDTVVKSKSPVLPKQSTFVISPKQTPKTPAFMQPPLPLRSCNKPHTAAALPRKGSQQQLNMEWTRKKFFDASSGIPQRRQQQMKQPPFANIVSPIRAYTQKSGTAPLMRTFRPTSTDMLTSLAISELEQESRLCQMKTVSTKQAGTCEASGGLGIKGIDSTALMLPKKAYISSEIKHVVDERTPMPMPSVPRIQKYLNSAVEPTVLRHDGKMKMAGETPRTPSSSHIPRRANHSLADLSLASGDVSLYTIRDAQKF